MLLKRGGAGRVPPPWAGRSEQRPTSPCQSPRAKPSHVCSTPVHTFPLCSSAAPASPTRLCGSLCWTTRAVCRPLDGDQAGSGGEAEGNASHQEPVCAGAQQFSCHILCCLPCFSIVAPVRTSTDCLLSMRVQKVNHHCRRGGGGGAWRLRWQWLAAALAVAGGGDGRQWLAVADGSGGRRQAQEEGGSGLVARVRRTHACKHACDVKAK